MTPMAEQERTTRRCFCAQRIDAMGNHTFRYSGQSSAWWFTDIPPRSMSKHAVFRAFIDRSEFDHVDHTGEPILFYDCPFCGGILPGTQQEDGKSDGPFGQADGNGLENL